MSHLRLGRNVSLGHGLSPQGPGGVHQEVRLKLLQLSRCQYLFHRGSHFVQLKVDLGGRCPLRSWEMELGLLTSVQYSKELPPLNPGSRGGSEVLGTSREQLGRVLGGGV